MPTEVFYTQLTCDQAISSLHTEVDAPLGWVFNNGFFFGKLSGTSFEIRPKLWYRGIYPPQFNGQLEPCVPNGSCLRLNYRTSSGWQISAGLTILTVGGLLASELHSEIIDWDNVFGTIGISSFFALVIVSAQILFQYEVKKARSFLVMLLQLEKEPINE